MNNHYKGLRSEDVVQAKFIAQGYTLLKRHWKTPYAELDLVFLHPTKARYCIIEVKTNAHEETLDYRLTARQRLRIQRASLWMRRMFHRDVDVYLALVKPDSQIILVNFEDFHL